jgi:hypothetical protein
LLGILAKTNVQSVIASNTDRVVDLVLLFKLLMPITALDAAICEAYPRWIHFKILQV